MPTRRPQTQPPRPSADPEDEDRCPNCFRPHDGLVVSESNVRHCGCYWGGLGHPRGVLYHYTTDHGPRPRTMHRPLPLDTNVGLD